MGVPVTGGARPWPEPGPDRSQTLTGLLNITSLHRYTFAFFSVKNNTVLAPWVLKKTFLTPSPCQAEKNVVQILTHMFIRVDTGTADTLLVLPIIGIAKRPMINNYGTVPILKTICNTVWSELTCSQIFNNSCQGFGLLVHPIPLILHQLTQLDII